MNKKRTRTMLGLEIPKRRADQVRKTLLKHSLINHELKIKRLGDYVYIPLASKPSIDVLEEIG
ncbi:MAG TPA: hypothetical protein PL055_06435, partial [Methanobacterium sp.]|nr:hypothetical protein [Methanobacterium sp.]